MTIQPATVGNSVLYTPGSTTQSAVSGGYAAVAGTVLATGPTGLVVDIRAMPAAGGDPLTLRRVPHASIAPVGSGSWSWAPGAAPLPSTVFQQAVSAWDGNPGIWTPLPCLAGWIEVIEQTITNTPAYYATQFYMGTAFPTPYQKSNGSSSITPLILFTGRVGSLSVNTANFASPTNFVCTIYSAGV